MSHPQGVETQLITSEDRPALAEAGLRAPPVVCNSREEFRAAVESAVREQLSVMGVFDTAKKASDVGKKAADALTDKGKEIEDKAIHQEKDARDEAHKKMNEDKAKKQGTQGASGLGASSRAFFKGLAEVRG